MLRIGLQLDRPTIAQLKAIGVSDPQLLAEITGEYAPITYPPTSNLQAQPTDSAPTAHQPKAAKGGPSFLRRLVGGCIGSIAEVSNIRRAGRSFSASVCMERFNLELLKQQHWSVRPSSHIKRIFTDIYFVPFKCYF